MAGASSDSSSVWNNTWTVTIVGGVIVGLILILISKLLGDGGSPKPANPTPSVHASDSVSPEPSKAQSPDAGRSTEEPSQAVHVSVLSPEDREPADLRLLRPRALGQDSFDVEYGFTPRWTQNTDIVHVMLKNYGVSRMTISIGKRPYGEGTPLASAGPFIASEPEMTVALEVPRLSTDCYYVLTKDEVTQEEREGCVSSDVTNIVDAGQLQYPSLSVGQALDTACGSKGSLVSVRGSGLSHGETLHVRLPAALSTGSSSPEATYRGIIDDLGNGHFPVVIKADRCTGKSIRGVVATLSSGEKLRLDEIAN